MSSPWIALLLVLCGWAAPTAQQPSADALAEQAAELRAALAHARTAADQLEREHAQQRSALAEALVELELERLTLHDASERARLAADQAEAQADADQAQQATVRAAFAQLADQARMYASELPGEEAPQVDFTGALAPAFDELAAWLDSADARAQTVGRRQMTLRTATGALAEVDLLNIGHVAFAYRESGTQTLGLACAAPRQAEGFRWRTDLPVALMAPWVALLDGRAQAGLVEVPLDVTASLRSDAELGAPSLRARFASGGPVMWPLALLAGLCAVLLAERVVVLYVRERPERDLGARVVAALDAGAPEPLVVRERSTVARTVAAVLRFRGAPRATLEDRLQETVLLQLPRLRRSLRTIAVLAAIAPLLGLLGTITGIIDTFDVLHATGSNDPSLMAGGISEALLTTATGLVIAIPVLLMHGLLRGRVEALVAAAEGQAVLVLNALTAEPGDVRS